MVTVLLLTDKVSIIFLHGNKKFIRSKQGFGRFARQLDWDDDGLSLQSFSKK